MEYVVCRSCNSLETRIHKDVTTRLTFLTCDKCGANVTVNSIIKGFFTQKKKKTNRNS